MSLTCGTVTTCCASKTPARRHRARTETSNRVPCTAVVGGTRVTSTRSCGSVGTLRTRHGRTLATSPKSTNQTLPRSGLVTAGLGAVEFLEQLVGRFDEGCVRQVGQHLGLRPP